MLEKLRFHLVRLLLGKRPLVANINIQFMEANSRDSRRVEFIGCTRGTVAGSHGLVAIGTNALSSLTMGNHSDHPFSPPVALFSPWTDRETHCLQPSAYKLKEPLLRSVPTAR